MALEMRPCISSLTIYLSENKEQKLTLHIAHGEK